MTFKIPMTQDGLIPSPVSFYRIPHKSFLYEFFHFLLLKCYCQACQSTKLRDKVSNDGQMKRSSPLPT